MEHIFLLLLFFSSSLCAGNQTYLGSGASLAVCQPDSCALISELAAMREKLAAMTHAQSVVEENLGAMVQKMANVEAKLQASNSQAEELKKTNQDQNEQLKALQETMAVGKAKAAFSAALGSSAGPFEQDTPLKYQRILSNIGSAYNPATGIFTAMVRGMYYFSYTMYNNNSGQPNSVVSLMMNSQRVVSTWDTEGNDSHDSATNAAVVQLEAGDSVFVQLYANRVLYDDGYYYNTFSGFLLFTM
ncbi:cerebellin-1-like [Centroberyx gerrardi]|uniref:cerebellin-1-like n=1 Tax=Centroberyx gerrardi TaxID=166262 RepID=UPI003AABA4BF